VDLDRLKKHMAETIQKAQRDDPNALRGEIARLLANLRREEAGRAEAVRRAVAAEKRPERAIVKIVEKPVIKPKDIVRLEKVLRELATAAGRIEGSAGNIRGHADVMRDKIEAFDRKQKQVQPSSLWTQVAGEARTMKVTATKSATTVSTKIPISNPEATRKAGYKTLPEIRRTHDVPKLRRGEAEILKVCCQVGSGASEAQLGVLSGFPSGGSTFKTYINTLKRNTLISNDGVTGWRPTDLGMEVAGPVDPMPTETSELVALWKKRLRAGECAILDLFVERHPKGIALRDIAKSLDPGPDDFQRGDQFTESTINTYVNTLKRCGLIVQADGVLRASETLFGAEVQA
jgi:hypothetical protein